MHPHTLGDGLKLIEQAGSGPGGVGSALILLLAASNGYGGGDFDTEDESGVIGRWAGDRVAIERLSKQLIYLYAEPQTSGVWLSTRIQNWLWIVERSVLLQIAVVGDYAEPEDLSPEHEAELVYDLCGTHADVSRRAAHLVDYARKSIQEEHADRASRLKKREPYVDITPQVREYLKREGIATYGDGEDPTPARYPTNR